MADSGDQSEFLIAEHSAPVFLTGLVTHETPRDNLGSDLDMTEASADVETYENFSVFSPLLILEEHDELVPEQSSPQRCLLEQQPFPEYDTVSSFSQNHDQGSIVGSSLAVTQDVGAQAVLLIEREAAIEPTTLRAADSSVYITATLKRALPDRESGESVRVQHTGSLQRKIKRAQTERDKAHAALEPLLDAERQKIGAYPQPKHNELLRYLEYPNTTQLKDSCYLFRFLYLAIGSWDTLADFSSQLQSAKEAQRSPGSSPPFPLTVFMAFDMMCRLDDQKTICILLKRYYAIKLLDGLQSSQPCESMQVETPETFGFGSTRQRGNPQVRQEAAEIKFLTSKIAPDLQPTSEKYSSVYGKVKRFRQLEKRLQILTKSFGIGILALLPSGPSFHGFSLTDGM